MKRFLLLFLLFAATKTFAQFGDTSQLKSFVRDTIKDRRPEKVTAEQLQRAITGTASFLTPDAVKPGRLADSSTALRNALKDTAAALRTPSTPFTFNGGAYFPNITSGHTSQGLVNIDGNGFLHSVDPDYLLPSQSINLIDSADPSNLRNDMPGIVKVTDTTYFVVYARYGATNTDAGGSNIYGVLTDANGKPKGTPYPLTAFTAGIAHVSPSPYKNAAGKFVIVFVHNVNSPVAYYLKAIESTDLITWSSPITIYTFSNQATALGNRAFQLRDGRYVYPVSEQVNSGTTSTSKRRKGKLFINTTGNIADWTDTGVSYFDRDSSMGEPGVFQKGNSLYYYCRNPRKMQLSYLLINDLVTFAPVGEYPLGLNSPNTSLAIIYDSINDIFIAAHNRVKGKLSSAGNADVNDRPLMDISVSREVLGKWESVTSIGAKRDRWYLEPALFVDGGKLFALYSEYTTWLSDYKYGLWIKGIPLVSILPKENANAFQMLNIFAYPDSTYQTGSNKMLRFFQARLRDYTTLDSAYFEMQNNSHNTWHPDFYFKNKGTFEGNRFTFDRDDILNAYPNWEIAFKYKGLKTGFPVTQSVIKHWLGDIDDGTIIFEEYADGRINLFERLKFVSKTASQASSFSQLGAGQAYFNSDSSRFMGYNGTVWKGLLYTSDIPTAYAISTATDANYTLVAPTTPTGYYILPAITAGRVVTLPSAATNSGKELILINVNASGNAWTYSVAVLLPDGTTTTANTNQKTTKLFSDGTQWRREFEQ